jgi:hypothetical protein
MRRIVRLTESDLTRIVRRVLSEEKNNNINEGAVINGITINSSPDGMLNAKSVKNLLNNYKVSVNCGTNIFGNFVTAYKGPVVISKLWNNKKDGGIGGEDNTGKVFTIPLEQSKRLALEMKSGNGKIVAQGEGVIAKISGVCYVTLNKRS